MSTEVLDVWNSLNHQLILFVNKKVNDLETSKDIVQDVFLKVYSKIETLKNRDKLIPWIYQITRNEVMSHFRKNTYDFSVENLEEVEVLDENFNTAFIESMHPIIDSLPEKYKEALILSDIKKVPQKEIAEKLGISYSGAKSRVQRGRAILKENLYKCCQISTDVYGNIVDCARKERATNCESDECN